ncbi:DUF669 domain-containing protein [Yanghanlia caeni]|uniref:DUF669 domain-containing protein n=1 Tax=Yanghanlia caeni TaxID=3064283 RepID=A0ABU1D536_9BURK|nr:DUF669 domain-containing protein [Alcaligenaceae bacterium LG-2]
MAIFAQTFDANAVEPSNYDVFPAGKYLSQIVASEMRPTKDGRGQYLFLELDILEGPFAGRKLFDRLNLVNDNPDTVDIATRTLSSICRATGQMQVKDSEQLHLIPLIADVRVRPPKGQYGESNSIRYLPRSAGASSAPAQRAPAAYASTPAPAAPPVQPAAPAAPASPIPGGLPWQRQA